MLPYRQRANVVEQSGALVAADVPVSVWPASGQTTRNAGIESDHMGEAPLGYSDELRGRNRRLVITKGAMLGRQFQITGAIEQDVFPHVQLELKSTGRV